MNRLEPKNYFVWPVDALEFPYAFTLFGRFQARTENGIWTELDSRRLQQIVAYLLLFRDRPHHRDVLSSTLWTDSSAKQSRKNLRQSLWHLQKIQQRPAGEPGGLLLTDRDWVQLNSSAVWLDVAELDDAYARVRAVPAEQIVHRDAEAAMEAARLYRGDLLDGWDEDWCVRERERTKIVYLAVLEKLAGYCDTHNRLDDGLRYANTLLAHDPAHERAHWRVMRLHHKSGNRSDALRQFEKCRTALDEELGVSPGRLTLELYEEICASG